MANTFTNILPVLTKAAQVVSRESIGILRAVNLDTSPDAIQMGASIYLPKAPAAAASAYAPSITPTVVDTTATGVSLTMTLAHKSDFHVTADQARAMNRGDATAMRWFELQAAQAYRVVANTIESYLFGLAYKASSRAIGTAGTTPFASTLDDVAKVAQILDENGAPAQGRSLILNPAAMALARARFANVASTQDRASFNAGLLPEISGLTPQMSNQITKHTKGTGTGFLLNKTAGWAVGDTTLAVDTGTGTIVIGDALLVGTGGREYIIKTALTGGNVVINAPGIFEAAANNAVLSVGNSYVPNLAMSRDAIYACVRAPLQDEDNRVAESTIVVDPVSGIPFGVYKQVGDGLTHYSIRAAYAAAVMESAHIATLKG
jgi:hypothetical protein